MWFSNLILFFLVVLLTTSPSLTNAKPLKKPYHHPSAPFKFSPSTLRKKFWSFLRQFQQTSRLPNRPLLPHGSETPFLLINVSWPRPTSTSSSLDLSRAEIDSAISIGSLRFGPGCRDTFSQQSVKFSGDDVYAPGWEAYLLSFPAPLENDSLILTTGSVVKIFATRQQMFSSAFEITATLYTATGNVAMVESLSLESTTTMNGECSASSSPVAELSVVDMNKIELNEKELENPNESPEPNPQLTEEPEIEESPVPDSFPPTLSTTSLLINFSWIPETDMETGIFLKDFFPSIFSSCSSDANYSYTSGDSFTGNYEAFVVDLGSLRADEVWTSEGTTITLLIDNYLEPLLGILTISASVLAPGGDAIGDTFTVTFENPSLSSATCTPNTSVAELSVNFNSMDGKYSISSLEEIISAKPSPEFEEEFEPTAEPTSDPEFTSPPVPVFPPILDTTSVLVNISWISSFTDIESGIRISFVGDQIFSTCLGVNVRQQEFIYTTGNSFNSIGSESFLIDLGKLRAEGNWTTPRANLTVYADWWSTNDNNGDASVTANIIAPGGEPIGNKFSVEEILPGVADSCTPSRPVAVLKIKFDEDTEDISIVNFTTDDLPPEITPEPIPVPTGEDDFDDDLSTPQPTSEDEEGPESSPGPFEPEVEEPMGEQRLLVKYSWPSDESDLDTEVHVASFGAGVASCGASGVVLFGGDSTSFGGSESYVVRLEVAKNNSVWIDHVDVELSAFWYARRDYTDGEATVEVELKNENDMVIGAMMKTFNPYSANTVDSAFCIRNKIGRVRISEMNGTLSMDFGLF